MDREILYRGQNYDGKWLVGNLIISNRNTHYIYPKEITKEDGHHLYFDSDDAFWVKKETVGQYSNKTTTNHHPVFIDVEKIFEHDIISFNDEKDVWLVKYSENGWYALSNRGDMYGKYVEYLKNNKKEIRKIGNIYDNPELFKDED